MATDATASAAPTSWVWNDTVTSDPATEALFADTLAASDAYRERAFLLTGAVVVGLVLLIALRR